MATKLSSSAITTSTTATSATNEEARRLTPLQAMVAAHYQVGEFGYIETQDDAQNVGDGLFTFCVNEAGDAGDKAEFINMLNRAIVQLRSLVGELRDTAEVPEELT